MTLNDFLICWIHRYLVIVYWLIFFVAYGTWSQYLRGTKITVTPYRKMHGCDWFRSHHVAYTKPNCSLTGQYFYGFKQYWLCGPTPYSFPSFEQYCSIDLAHDGIATRTTKTTKVILPNATDVTATWSVCLQSMYVCVSSVTLMHPLLTPKSLSCGEIWAPV